MTRPFKLKVGWLLEFIATINREIKFKNTDLNFNIRETAAIEYSIQKIFDQWSFKKQWLVCAKL